MCSKEKDITAIVVRDNVTGMKLGIKEDKNGEIKVNDSVTILGKYQGPEDELEAYIQNLISNKSDSDTDDSYICDRI